MFPALHRAGLIEARRNADMPGPGSDGFPALHRAGLIEARSARASGTCRRRFRPFTGPASLKPETGDSGRDRRGSFRPFTGPASLKRVIRKTTISLTPAFPALHRAGLIEARCRRRRTHRRAAAFPALHRAGLIEAAAAPRRRCRRSRRFPALHRAGLIEASTATGAAVAGASWVFPALHRAGLIEASGAPGPGAAPRRFRPFTGPASLKQPRRPPQPARQPPFPALHRAGLIEAARSRRRRRSRSRVSGPSQGRPH